MPTVDAIAAAVDSAVLTPIVRQALNEPRAEIGEWTCKQLQVVSGLPDYRGLFRFKGSAEVGGDVKPWSAILKVARRHPTASDNPAHSGFWNREALAFRSGLLSDLPGLTAVRCYDITETKGSTFVFWLEDLVDEYENGWPLERYGLAARHLGQMGGAYLEKRTLPDQDWLLRRPGGAGGGGGWAAAGALINDERTWQHPDVKRAYPEPIAERLKQQWADRRAFQNAIARLPTTLCHNDSHTENLFSRSREDGTQETVAIDWELVGIGPLSGDITYLVIATLRRMAVDMKDADALEDAVLDGYVAGLRDAGWSGDERAVRLGFTAAVASRLGLVPQTLDLILNEQRREQVERSWHRPVEEVIKRWAQVAYFVLDRADRARQMLAAR